MKSSLVIDRGNTSLKATLFQGFDCVCSRRFEEGSDLKYGLSELCRDIKPDGAIFASTGKRKDSVLGTIASVLGFAPLEYKNGLPLPVHINYRSFNTLGADRVGAAVGAYSLLEEGDSGNFHSSWALVADAGTALTLDVMSRSTGFHGGRISPGIELRLKSLHEYTSALPEVDRNGDCPVLGYDTETCMRSGALYGVIAEISLSLSQWSDRFGEGEVILTGGDAPLLMKLIGHWGWKLRYEPNLVAIGLNKILYHYNETVS